jgi:hypothetical protein
VNLLFCATDAGGARNLVPVARLAQSAHNVRFLVGPATQAMVHEAGLVSEYPDFTDEAGAAATLSRYAPEVILLGTTGRPAAEAWLTVAARGRIPTIVVLDEWYNYRLRFAYAESELSYLPDLICCQDELARTEAAREGVDAARLHVTASPALAALADRIEAMAQIPPSPPAIFAALPRPIIVFLSETHAADYGWQPGHSGRLGPFIGYDENSVRSLLANQLAAAGRPASIFERLHPSDQSRRPAPTVGSQQVWHTDRERSPLWPILWHADAVVGMRSMALLEAALMGHRPAALQPGLIGPDVCTASRLGLADRLDNAASLDRWIRQVLNPNRPMRQPPKRPPFAATGAAARVLALTDASARVSA